MAQHEEHIRAWLASFVIGLDLCPFAKPLEHSDKLRIRVSDAVAPEALRSAFLRELDLLQSSTEEEIATILLAFPFTLSSFDDYLDFLDEAQALVVAAGLEDLVQLASFHPDYQFEGEPADAPGNFSNRSPYPMIHLLRENMLTRVLAEFQAPEQIPQQNIRTLEALGLAELRRRWQGLFDS
ncbi:MAG: DUF1415 domain-containing protein [Halioglobus sp.]